MWEIEYYGGVLVLEFLIIVLFVVIYFFRRNCIISGLSFVVLVVEVILKSGFLIIVCYVME